MFHQLTRYVFEQWLQPELPQSGAAEEGVEQNTQRLTASVAAAAEEEDDEWVLVERCRSGGGDGADSEGNSECSSMESVDGDEACESPDDEAVLVPAAMEESWFLTPPPCFISTGPVHMQTSPLENLLIEHPSMSVYTHHTRLRIATPPPLEEAAVVVEVQVAAAAAAERPRVNRVHLMQQQQERQGLKGRQAQQVQIKKSCKFIKRGYLDRNNKAREVNSRNRRQRRGERSQGAKRSFANNNRKC